MLTAADAVVLLAMRIKVHLTCVMLTGVDTSSAAAGRRPHVLASTAVAAAPGAATTALGGMRTDRPPPGCTAVGLLPPVLDPRNMDLGCDCRDACMGAWCGCARACAAVMCMAANAAPGVMALSLQLRCAVRLMAGMVL